MDPGSQAQELKRLPWSSGTWFCPPESIKYTEGGDDHMIVKAKKDSDFWLKTSYGFTHYNGHALLYDDFP